MIHSIHSLWLFVDNIEYYTNLLQSAFSFETKWINESTVQMTLGDIRLTFKSSKSSDEINEFLKYHGDGVAYVFFEVNDFSSFSHSIILNNSELDAKLFEESLTINVFGHTKHVLASRDYLRKHEDYFPCRQNPSKSHLLAIDHLAINVEYNSLSKWVDFYIDILCTNKLSTNTIETPHGIMDSVVLQAGSQTLVLVAPGRLNLTSQNQRYIDQNGGPGVQHIAFLSKDIVADVRQAKKFFPFQESKNSYYQSMLKMHKGYASLIENIMDTRILIDFENNGYLLQIFSKPVTPQQTLFLELIQRNNASGFGIGNIRALYESVEM